MKKQILFFVMMLLPMVAMADASGKCGSNLTWTYIASTKTLYISGTGDMYSYGYDYPEARPWNTYKSVIEKIIIEDGVTSIGSSAFYKCSGLTSITIPNSVTSIEGYAFYGCFSLTSVTIPNNVASIGYCTFYDCSGLTSVTIPNSVTSIGGYAFCGCSGLTSVTIPNNVKSIGNSAFDGTAWYNNQPNGLVYAGKVAYKYKGNMPGGTQIVLKDGTLGIAGYAFYYRSGLVSVTIPNSVTTIGGSAFYGCSDLTSITLNSNAIVSKNYTSSSNLQNIFGSQVEEYILGEGVKRIGDRAFHGCSILTSVTIPNSVTSIGISAFEGCI